MGIIFGAVFRRAKLLDLSGSIQGRIKDLSEEGARFISEENIQIQGQNIFKGY